VHVLQKSKDGALLFIGQMADYHSCATHLLGYRFVRVSNIAVIYLSRELFSALHDRLSRVDHPRNACSIAVTAALSFCSKQMSINAQRNRCVCMSDPSRHCQHIDAARNERRDVSVTQCVEVDRRQLAGLHEARPITG
jgi:hypothetical protein